MLVLVIVGNAIVMVDAPLVMEHNVLHTIRLVLVNPANAIHILNVLVILLSVDVTDIQLDVVLSVIPIVTIVVVTLLIITVVLVTIVNHVMDHIVSLREVVIAMVLVIVLR